MIPKRTAARSSVLALLLVAACGRSGSGREAPAATSAPATSADPPTSVPASASAANASASASAASAAPPASEPVASASASAAASGSAAARNPVIKDKAKRLVAQPPGPVLTSSGSVAGPIDPGHDAGWLRRLTSEEIVAASFNGGGASVTIRVQFADGGKALFKPHQRMAGSNFRAEIAAYHLDRLLGLGRVAPVAGRPLSMAWLRQQLAGADPAALRRLDDEVLTEGDRVWGALIAWHTRPPTVAEPPPGWLTRMNPGEPAEPLEQVLAWSDMVLFDTLIDNTDRWSGGNVMTLGAGGPLIFLDNASAFLGYRAHRKSFLEKPLTQICRFRQKTVAALRATGPAAEPPQRLSARLGATLARDPSAPVLSPALLSALDERLERVLRHLDTCIERHGEEPTAL